MKRTAAVAIVILASILLLLLGFGLPSATLAQDPAPAPAAANEGNVTPVDLSAPVPATDCGNAPDATYCMNGYPGWERKAPLPTAVRGSGVASDGQYVYVAGGDAGPVTPVTDSFARYDPETDAWTALTPLPTAVRYALAVYAQGKIFIFGGETSTGVMTQTVQIYTISTSGWSAGAAMPDVRSQMGGGYSNGKIYLAGGYAGSAVNTAQDQTWEYTLATNSWASTAALPTPLGGPGYGVVNAKLYVLGGRSAAGAVLQTVYQYDIAGRVWSRLADMPAAVNLPGSAVFGERIWVFGGGTPFMAETPQSPERAQAVTATYVYDPATGAWQTGLAQNVARYSQGGAAAGSRIISVGGASTQITNTVEVLTHRLMKILIAYADFIVPTTLRMSLLARPGVGQVDVYNAGTATPPLELLRNYDIVLPFSNLPFNNSGAFGDVLADYADSGGIVVAPLYDWTSGYELLGRWSAGGYSPLIAPSTLFTTPVTLGGYVTGHPLMQGVIIMNTTRHAASLVAPGATQVAAWSDSRPAVVAKGRVVAINAFLGDLSPRSWDGDIPRLIVNAGNWLWLTGQMCAALVCPNSTQFKGAITATDPVFSGGISRDEPASTCAQPQSCSASNALSYHYDSYVFWNNSGDQQCVTVTLSPGSCTGLSGSLQSAAYLGTLNPASTCANFLGDIGLSPSQNKSYSFTVPSWITYTVVVNEAVPDTYCSAYTLNVSAGNCPIKKVRIPLLYHR